MTDFERRPVEEPGLQPDPMLETGRRSTGWLWLFALAIVAVVFGTLYGINNQDEQTVTNEGAATETTGQNAAPQSPISGGRGTANAPKEQQAQGQTGNGNGAEQNPAAGTQGNQGTTTGQGGQADQNNASQNKQDQQAPRQQ